MHILFFEDHLLPAFYPLALTRPVAELRVGITTIREKWEQSLGHPSAHLTRTHLQALFPGPVHAGPGYLINSRLIPTAAVVDQIRALGSKESLHDGDILLAVRFDLMENASSHSGKSHLVHSRPFLLQSITDVFARNGEALQLDFDRITAGRESRAVGEAVTILGPKNQLFLEQGAKVNGCTINTTTGPVYVGHEAEIMEGSLIRGALAVCDHAVVKMGAKIYGPTTIGPESRIGGEISNSVIQGYSNKGHDGFLGNSVIGEWCNLGADTNTSNLKNNYSSVKTWDYAQGEYTDSGLAFCGLVMGDHSKSGINTMFNTGTTAGVAANIFGSGFPEKFIPSFSWGAPEGTTTYRLDEALVAAERMMARRNVPLSDQMRAMLTEVYRITQEERTAATLRQS